MSRKTRKLIWSAPLVVVLAVAGALAIFAAQLPGSVFANDLPGTPTGLTAKADGRTAVDLSWTAPTDGGSIDGYRIDRSTDGQTWFAHKGDTMANLVQGTSYKDTDLKPGTDYIYRVFSVNDHGAGPTSDDVGTTTDEVTAPGKVRNLRATKGQYPTKVVVTWAVPADNGGKPITAYYVNIKSSADDDVFPDTADRFMTVPVTVGDPVVVPMTGLVVKVSVETSICETNGSSTGTTITWEHKDLLANQTYSYKVFASNGSTASDPNTQDESDTPVGNTGKPVIPSRVTNLTAIQAEAIENAKGAAVFLYWIKPESNGGQTIDGYRIHISKNNRDWPRLSDDVSANADAFGASLDNSVAVRFNALGDDAATTSAHEFTHVIPPASEKTWYYRVYTETKATDEETEIPLRSARATASLRFGTIVPRTVETATLMAIGVSHDRIDLDWEEPIWDKDTGFTYMQDAGNPASDRRTPNGYRIDVSTDGINWDKVLEDNTTLALPEFTDDEARVGKPYYYRVFPLYGSRPGPASRTTEGVTTMAPVAPGNVKNLSVREVSAGRIDVTWEAPDDDGGSDIIGYRVEHYKNDADVDPILWMQLGDANRLSCQLSATDKGLSAEETRTYRVIALNKQNDGVPSNGIDDADDGPGIDIPTNIEERQATTTDADLPPAPKGLTVESAKDSNIKSRENRGILVYWNAPDDPDGAPISNYRVERKVKADTASQYGEWEWVQTCLASVGTLLYTHCTDPDEPKLTTAGEERMYKVAAQNAAGIGMFTDAVTTPRPAAGHTHEPVAGPEVGPATSVTTGPFNAGGTIQVSWDAAPNATGYIIYAVNVDELDDPDGQIVVAPVNDAAAETFNLGGLNSGDTYDIYVVATAKEMVAWPTSTDVPQVAAE